MPWCEYLIKCYAWNRMEKDKWRKVRMIAFNARIGSHLNPKSLPRSEEDFLPIDKERKGYKVSKEVLEQLKKEREEYELHRKNNS